MRLLNIIFTLITCIYISGCITDTTATNIPTTIKMQKNEYRLGSGDKIRITIFGHENLSGEFNIASNGNISMPLINEIKAQGLTTNELEKAIWDKLNPEYLINPSVNVEIINYRDIYILGEVRNPGKYQFIPNMTVRKAVAIAGGYTYRANEKTAELTRQKDNNLITKKVDPLFMVMPGDTIIITKRWF